MSVGKAGATDPSSANAEQHGRGGTKEEVDNDDDDIYSLTAEEEFAAKQAIAVQETSKKQTAKTEKAQGKRRGHDVKKPKTRQAESGSSVSAKAPAPLSERTKCSSSSISPEKLASQPTKQGGGKKKKSEAKAKTEPRIKVQGVARPSRNEAPPSTIFTKRLISKSLPSWNEQNYEKEQEIEVGADLMPRTIIDCEGKPGKASRQSSIFRLHGQDAGSSETTECLSTSTGSHEKLASLSSWEWSLPDEAEVGPTYRQQEQPPSVSLSSKQRAIAERLDINDLEAHCETLVEL